MKRYLAAAILTIVGVTGVVSVAEAAPPASGTISVADSTHGSTVVAVTSGALIAGEDIYVFVQCHNPVYVYAAFFPVAPDGSAILGPIASSLWASGDGECNAEAGWFTKNGFGKWRATTNSATFQVDG